ncbi:hypothetical protein BRADI_2g40473v3 [Brachypodium distachyon]|uniref:Uncharacterized protein n=1 Tax=Brachypodium distachyon TaxID=15368 RepID=A0A2K2DD01_BRADI|nr:hypothetical protein BRADI_2g40473v3 [Brachypodium distachyon]
MAVRPALEGDGTGRRRRERKFFLCERTIMPMPDTPFRPGGVMGTAENSLYTVYLMRVRLIEQPKLGFNLIVSQY